MASAGVAYNPHAKGSPAVIEELGKLGMSPREAMAYATVLAMANAEIRLTIALALLPPGWAIEQDWQPMATAPRGTRNEVMLYAAGTWAPCRRAKGGGWEGSAFGEELFPSRWRPLPTPPPESAT